MKKIVISFLVCLSINCAAQMGATTYLNEQFDNNNNGWLSNNDTSEYIGLNIVDGELVQDGGKSGSIAMIKRPIDDSRDFEIEISYTILKRPDKVKNAGRLFWGYSDSLGGAWIGLSLNYLPFTYCRGGDHKKDKHRRIYTYPHLKIGIPVILLIRKESDRYYISINGKRERRLKFEHLPGDDLALDVQKNSILKVQYLSIRYLN